MSNSALKCTFEEKIKIPLLACTKCTEHYMVLERVHKCNDVVPCELRGKKTYLEKYWKELDVVPDLPFNYIVRGVDCDKCHVQCEQKNVARKAICPQCEFSGWYVFDDSNRLCPVCVAAGEENKQKQQVKVETVVKTVEKPREYLFLKVRTLSTGHSPELGSCVMVEITSSPVSPSPLEWKVDDKVWFLKEEGLANLNYMINTWPNMEDLRDLVSKNCVETPEAVQSMVEYLKSLSTNSDYSWDMSGNSTDWKWLTYLFAKYASTEDQKLLHL